MDFISNLVDGFYIGTKSVGIIAGIIFSLFLIGLALHAISMFYTFVSTKVKSTDEE